MINESPMNQVAIDLGSLPAVDLQVNNPRLRNGFVNKLGHIQLLPASAQLEFLQNTRAIFFSTFNDRIILVTFNQVFYYENSLLTFIGEIIFSSLAVRIAENRQNQVTIVNGTGAWVWDQNDNSFAKLNEIGNGFTLNNPVDVIELDTFTIIVGGRDKAWTPSDPNNALQYNQNVVEVTDNSLGDLTGIEALDNNLFIFGEGGVQRWVPSIERTPSSFPFTQDPNYRDEYGCLSTASLISKNNEMFYLSNSGQIRYITLAGGQVITNDGISSIINSYTDKNSSVGSYYFHKGHYLYQITFPSTQNAFLYCPDSKRWSESSDLIIGYDEFPIKQDGLYQFNEDYNTDYFKVFFQTDYFIPNNKNLKERVALNQVLMRLTQGKGESADVQVVDLQVSKDNILFGNSIRRQLSKVGKRLFQLRWYMNIPNNAFCLRFRLEVKQDITIESLWAAIN